MRLDRAPQWARTSGYIGVVAALGITALVVMTVFSSAVAAQSSATLVADRDEYYTGETATVTLTGLTECAGQQVELGFLQIQATPGAPIPVGDATPVVTVGNDGSASVSMTVTQELITFHTSPVVRGDCVPGGEIFGFPRALSVHSGARPGTPPGPPDTGTGAAIADEGPGFGPIAAMSGLVAIVAAGALAIGTRLGNRRG